MARIIARISSRGHPVAGSTAVKAVGQLLEAKQRHAIGAIPAGCPLVRGNEPRIARCRASAAENRDEDRLAIVQLFDAPISGVLAIAEHLRAKIVCGWAAAHSAFFLSQSRF